MLISLEGIQVEKSFKRGFRASKNEANYEALLARLWMANIRDTNVKRFIWRNTVTCFGVPNVLILDNGLQFN